MTWNPKRWTHRHQAVLMHLIEHAGQRAHQIAAATGYSPDHVLHLMRTPEFRRRWQVVRAEVDTMVLNRYVATLSAPSPPQRELQSSDNALAALDRYIASHQAPSPQRRRRRLY